MVPGQRIVGSGPVGVIRGHPVHIGRLREHRHRQALAVPGARRLRSVVGSVARRRLRHHGRRRRSRARHPVARGPLEPVHAGALTGNAVAGPHVGALRAREVGDVLRGRAHEPGLPEGTGFQRAVGPLPAVAALARVGRGAGADAVAGAGDFARAVGDSRDDVAAVSSASLVGASR